MLAPTAPGIAMASCRQWSTPGTSLLSAVGIPPCRASLPRPPVDLLEATELAAEARLRAVTVGHPGATARRPVAPAVRPAHRASFGTSSAASGSVVALSVRPLRQGVT